MRVTHNALSFVPQSEAELARKQVGEAALDLVEPTHAAIVAHGQTAEVGQPLQKVHGEIMPAS